MQAGLRFLSGESPANRNPLNGRWGDIDLEPSSEEKASLVWNPTETLQLYLKRDRSPVKIIYRLGKEQH
jgi:hypothetical protein